MTQKKMTSENLLKEFTYYFELFVENELTKWQKYLDGNPDYVEPSTSANILTNMASELPFGGNFVSSAVSSADKWNQNRKESTKAKKIFDIIHFFDNDKTNFRKILIEGAFDIFYTYQHQFSMVSCDEGPLRAMQKLGMDASQRFLNFVFDNGDIHELTNDVVAKGVVLGKSDKHQKNIFVRGRKLEIIGSKKKIRTKDVFRHVGLRVGNAYIAAYDDKKHIKELGYREKFAWEDTSNLKFLHAIDPKQFSLRYIMSIKEKEEYLKFLTAHITSKDAFDNMKEYIRLEFESLKSQSIGSTEENKEMIVNMSENVSNIHKELSEERRKSDLKINQLMEETARAKKYCVLRVYDPSDHAGFYYNTPPHHFHPIPVA